MSVKLRLARVGKKKSPIYRVVVADERAPRDGRFIEIIGQYHPQSDPSVINIKDDRALYWLAKGAQPTDTVHKLLTASGVWEQYKKENPAKAQARDVAAKKVVDAVQAKKAEEAKKAEAEKKAQEAEEAAAKAEAEAAAAPAEEASEETAADEAPAEESAE